MDDGSFLYPQVQVVELAEPSVWEPPRSQPQSSITPSVIEQETRSPPNRSITPPVIEQETRSPPQSSITLGTYIRRRGDREYQYWRLSWREGKRIKHRHVPSSELPQVRAALKLQT